MLQVFSSYVLYENFVTHSRHCTNYGRGDLEGETAPKLGKSPSRSYSEYPVRLPIASGFIKDNFTPLSSPQSTFCGC